MSDCLPSCPPLCTSSEIMGNNSLYLALLCPYAAASRSMLPPMSDRIRVNPVPNLSARKLLSQGLCGSKKLCTPGLVPR